MIEEFKLIGLNGGRTKCYATVEIGNEDWFHADFEPNYFLPDRQVALFNYFKNSEDNLWSGANIRVKVDFEGYSTGNMPINPKIIGINNIP